MIGIAQLASTVTVWTDSIMIGAMMGTSFVGVYKIAISMSATLGAAIGSINRVVFPVLVSIETKHEESVSNLNKVLKYGGFFAIPAMFGLSFFSMEIIALFFGQQYIDASYSLLILSYLCFDVFFTGALISYFSAKKEVKIISYSASLCAILNVIFNFILIPILGLVGAAIASVVSRLINLGIMLFEGKRKLGLSISFDNFQKPLLGSIFMVFVLLLLKQFIVIDNIPLLVICVGIGGFAYILFEALIGFNVITFGMKAINLLLEGDQK
jgi:O-antigen/teichoic acid export membrane protein